MTEKKIILTHNPAVSEAKIREILGRGKVVLFTNKITGVKKYLTEWNKDAEGDFIAAYSTGKTKYICTEALEYDISEVDSVPMT